MLVDIKKRYEFNPWLITSKIKIAEHEIKPGVLTSKPSSCARYIEHAI